MGPQLGSLVAVLAVACGSKKAEPVAPGGDEAQCEPGRCLEDISKLIQADREKARACYDLVAKKKPDLGEGRVIINFEIDPDGAVVDASQGMQDNQIMELEVVDCVAAYVRAIKFPKSPGGKKTRAYHRFEFNKQ